MASKQSAWKTKDRRQLLLAILEHCKGDSSASFEGNLSKLSLAKLEGASLDETAALKHGTRWPKQDFVVLPLERLTPTAVMAALGGSIPSSILHIQVAKNGKLAFGAYDNFQHLHFGEPLNQEFIAQLASDGVLEQAR